MGRKGKSSSLGAKCFGDSHELRRGDSFSLQTVHLKHSGGGHCHRSYIPMRGPPLSSPLCLSVIRESNPCAC